MTDLSRRETLAAAMTVAAVAALPATAAPAGSAAAWDLTELYPTDAAWEAARRQALAAIPRMAAHKGKLGSAEGLAAALAEGSDLVRTINRLGTYAGLKGDEDVRVAANQERRSQIDDLYAAYGEANAWLVPELIALGRPKVAGFVAASPTLRTRFAHYIDDTFRTAEHTLSPSEEALLAAAGPAMQSVQAVRGQLVAADIPRPTVTLNDGRTQRLDDQGYTLTRDTPNRADRKKVFDAFWGSYAGFENSIGAAYAGKLRADVFEMKARKYPTTVARALSSDNIPEQVYRTLVAETNAGLPQLHRYFDLRRRMLNLPDMNYYDIYPPLVSLDRKVTLAEMRTITIEAVRPLGPEYGRLFADATAKRWMDPLPRPGKASGAYMNPGAYDVHPYLLLNLGENYAGMSTYAHEWGHAMHTLLAKGAQPYEMSDYSIFTAEIASTLNEQLLFEYMLRNAKTREEKLFYLGQQMENIRGTFYRQTMFAEFELRTHEMAEHGEGLSGARFTAAYLDLLKRYHGPKVTIDPDYAVEWMFVSHFFRGYYVYQYATCIAAATYFARKMLSGGPKERDDYLSVLSAGGSDYPYQILQRAGLDMASPDPYRATVAAFKDVLDQAEALIQSG